MGKIGLTKPAFLIVLLIVFITKGNCQFKHKSELLKTYDSLFDETIIKPFEFKLFKYLSKTEAKKYLRSKTVLDSSLENIFTFYTHKQDDSFLIETSMGFLTQILAFPLLQTIADYHPNRSSLLAINFNLHNIIIWPSPFEYMGVEFQSDKTYYAKYGNHLESSMFSVFFMYLHELGHTANWEKEFHGFHPKTKKDRKKILKRELNADEWAINLLLKYYFDISRKDAKNRIPKYFLYAISFAFNYFFQQHDSKSYLSKYYVAEFTRKKKVFNILKKKLCGDSLFRKICNPIDSSLEFTKIEADESSWKKRSLDIINEDTTVLYERIKNYSKKLDQFINDKIKNPTDTFQVLDIDSFNFLQKGKRMFSPNIREDFAYSLLNGNWYFRKNIKMAIQIFELLAHSSQLGLWLEYPYTPIIKYKIEEFNIICANYFQYTEKNIPRSIYYYNRGMSFSQIVDKDYYVFKLNKLRIQSSVR